MSEDCFLNKDGMHGTHNYIWLKNITTSGNASGKEISLEAISCDISQPISTMFFPQILGNLQACLQYNYLSAILLMGAGIMCFHYRKLIELLRFCPQVLAVGLPPQGKAFHYKLLYHYLEQTTAKIYTILAQKLIACSALLFQQSHLG